jgi:hypothetical protein
VILFSLVFFLTNDGQEDIVLLASCVGIVLVALLFAYEVLQMLSTGFRRYITDPQNILDVITYISYMNIFVW